MKKIGLYFGSFNPIHVGHLMIANQIRQIFELDQVWFVVSPHNPHKSKDSLLADHHRLALVNEAIEGNPYFRAENIEFSMPQPSYTIDTLVRLKEDHPNKQFGLIMGADNLRTFHKWKNYEKIVENYQVYVYPRLAETSAPASRFSHPNVVFCDKMPQIMVSASYIRDLLAEGKSIQYLVTEPVRKYIEEMHFYQ